MAHRFSVPGSRFISTFNRGLCPESLRQISLFSGRHARSEHGIRYGRASNLCSPPADGSFGRGSTLRKAPAHHVGRNRFLDTAFHCQRRRLPCGFLRSRVVAPGLYLQNHPGSSASPYRFRAPGLVLALKSPSAARSVQETRCKAFFQDSSFVFKPPLPPGPRGSFGIVALSLTSDEEACFYRSPDLPSLPAARKIISYPTRAPDHRSRSATSCQACWSSKTLGTIPKVHPRRRVVNQKLQRSQGYISFIINQLQGAPCYLSVYKTAKF